MYTFGLEIPKHKPLESRNAYTLDLANANSFIGNSPLFQTISLGSVPSVIYYMCIGFFKLRPAMLNVSETCINHLSALVCLTKKKFLKMSPILGMV